MTEPRYVTAVVITRGDLPELMAERKAQFERLGMQHIIIESPDVLTRWLTAERHVRTPYVFFQDDDVALPDEMILQILEKSEPDKMVCSMYDEWIENMHYEDLALVGLGAVVPHGIWKDAIERWIAAYPGAKDHLAWDADFIVGVLTPFVRYDFGGKDVILPEASADNRLWKQPGQHERKYKTIEMARKLRTVTGAVMFKNDEEHIERAIESVAPMVDHFTLLDTGCTDHTREKAIMRIRALGKSFDVIERPFDNMQDSRNALIAEARKHADYFLMFDSDEEWLGNKELPPLALDVFIVNYAGPIAYGHPRIIRSGFDCRFEGTVHAAMTWTDDARGMVLEDLTILHHGDLTHGDAEARIRRDIDLLTKDLDAGVDPPHTLFMRAKSYEGVQEWEKARADYEARLEFPDEGSEEQYYSAWRLGCLLIEMFGQFDQGADHLYSAWMNRRGRIESIRALARYLNAVADATPIPATDIVFVHRDEYNAQGG